MPLSASPCKSPKPHHHCTYISLSSRLLNILIPLPKWLNLKDSNHANHQHLDHASVSEPRDVPANIDRLLTPLLLNANLREKKKTNNAFAVLTRFWKRLGGLATTQRDLMRRWTEVEGATASVFAITLKQVFVEGSELL
jgi:hypothetical protein